MVITISSIAAAALTVAQVLAVAGLALQTLKIAGTALISIGKALGIIKPETKVEDLGDKALQSGLLPGDFDTYADYVKHVEEYKLDPEKSKLTTEEDKIKKGIELAVGVAIENFQGFPIEDFCTAVGQNPEYFTDLRMSEITKLFQNDGQNISAITNFINGSEKDSSKIKDVVDSLIKVEKNINPQITDNDALKNVMQARK